MPGRYEIEVELVQDGESLARCGVQAVRFPLQVGERPPAAAPEDDADMPS